MECSGDSAYLQFAEYLQINPRKYGFELCRGLGDDAETAVIALWNFQKATPAVRLPNSCFNFDLWNYQIARNNFNEAIQDGTSLARSLGGAP